MVVTELLIVYNALVLLICCDLLAGMLHLQQQLDPLDGCYRCLGDGCGHSTGQEVLGEGHSGICHVESKKRRGRRVRDRAGLTTGFDSRALSPGFLTNRASSIPGKQMNLQLQEEQTRSGEEEDGDEAEEGETPTGKQVAENDEDDNVDTKKQKTEEDA